MPESSYAEISQLAAGVTLIHAPMPGNGRAGVILMVGAGSRDESFETAGLAHYLEHMFFKGTKRQPSGEKLSRELALLGTESNAYTDIEETWYEASGPEKNAQRIAEIFCEMIASPLFLEAEVERERNVVLQELASIAADPVGWLDQNMHHAAFGGKQPMSFCASGRSQVVKRVSRDYLLDYRNKFYSGDRMALVICGGRDLDYTVINQHLAGIPEKVDRPKRVGAIWGQGETAIFKRFRTPRGEDPQVRMRLMLPGIPSTAADMRAMNMMALVLGGGSWSRLYVAGRERTGLCYQIDSTHEGFEDCGVFTVELATQPKDVRQATQIAFQEVQKLAEKGPNRLEMQMARAVMGANIEREEETVTGRAERIARRWRMGLAQRHPTAQVAAYEKVLAGEVRAAAQLIASRLPELSVAMAGAADCRDEVAKV